MSIIEIADLFVFYGLDVMLLAAATAVTVQLLKKTVMKNVQNKLYTFLPFVTGALYYAVYRGLCEMSFCHVLENYADILEHGMAVGSLATMIYVLYEQFVRQKKSSSAAEDVIGALIEGYVPDESRAKVAALIAAALSRDVSGSGADKTEAILSENAAETAGEREIKLLAQLIINTLARLYAV